MKDLIPKEKTYSELSVQLDQLQTIVMNLQKENEKLKISNKHLSDADKRLKEYQNQIEQLEKEKIQLNEDLYQVEKTKKDIICKMELEHSSELRNKQAEINNLTEKNKHLHNLDKTKHVFEKDVTLLKYNLIQQKQKYEEEMQSLKREHDHEFDSLNNDMLARINNTKQNIKQINMEHLDVSTKLTLLQNHQLLIELEYQSQQIQDLIQKKEALERRVFELEKDVEIHKEVENVLAEKNKKLSNTLKNIVSQAEKSKPFAKNSLFDDIKENNKEKELVKTAFSQTATSSKFEEVGQNSSCIKLESKIRKLEKEIEKKNLEYGALQLSYDKTKQELMKFTEKSKGIIKVFETELNVVKTGEVCNSKEFFINVDNLHQFKYQELDASHRFSLLMFLIEYLISILNVSDFGDEKSLISKLKKKNFELKFHNSNSHSVNLNDKKIMNPLKDNQHRLINNNATVIRGKIFKELLPTISDSRFSLNKNFSVLKS